MRRGKVLLAIGFAALLVAGCGPEASGSKETQAPVDVRKLDAGGYKTTPVTTGKPTLEQARLAEGQRLANYLPLPMDIDPRFKYQTGNIEIGQFGFTEKSEATGLFADNLDTDTPGFTAGFNVEAQSDNDSEIAIQLHYSVLAYRDSASAAAASKTLHDIQFEHNTDFLPTNIDKHPETHTFWQPSTDTIQAFTATDTYVLYTSVVDQGVADVKLSDLSELTDIASKVIDAIPPALKNFHPTPNDQLTDMKLDRDGMIGHSLFQTVGADNGALPEIYDQHGALLLSDRPATDRDLYARTGMDLMVKNAGRLYRTKDNPAAQVLLDDRGTVRRFYRAVDPPRNLTAARCLERKDGIINSDTGVPRFYCVVAYGRYVAEVRSEQIIDVHQRISAQYALLTKQ